MRLALVGIQRREYHPLDDRRQLRPRRHHASQFGISFSNRDQLQFDRLPNELSIFVKLLSALDAVNAPSNVFRQLAKVVSDEASIFVTQIEWITEHAEGQLSE